MVRLMECERCKKVEEINEYVAWLCEECSHTDYKKGVYKEFIEILNEDVKEWEEKFTTNVEATQALHKAVYGVYVQFMNGCFD